MFREEEIVFENQHLSIHYKSKQNTILLNWRKQSLSISNFDFNATLTAIYQSISAVKASILYIDATNYNRSIREDEIRQIDQIVKQYPVKTCIVIDSQGIKGKQTIRDMISGINLVNIDLHLFSMPNEAERWYEQFACHKQADNIYEFAL